MFRRGLSLGDALCPLEPWYGETLLAMKQGEYSGGEKAPITGGKRKLINGAGIESAKSANEANRYVAGKSNAGFKGGSLLTYPTNLSYSIIHHTSAPPRPRAYG